MTDHGMHHYHVEAALRQPEVVRIARAEVDAFTQALLGYETARCRDEVRADVESRDRATHL